MQIKQGYMRHFFSSVTCLKITITPNSTGRREYYITWLHLVKNLTPWEEMSAGLIDTVSRVTKALMPWD
jgi:hypothetical protein